jgi:hypothetical protein
MPTAALSALPIVGSLVGGLVQGGMNNAQSQGNLAQAEQARNDAIAREFGSTQQYEKALQGLWSSMPDPALAQGKFNPAMINSVSGFSVPGFSLDGSRSGNGGLSIQQGGASAPPMTTAPPPAQHLPPPGAGTIMRGGQLTAPSYSPIRR